MTETSCRCSPLKQFKDEEYVPHSYDFGKNFYQIEFPSIQVNETCKKYLTIRNGKDVPCNFFVKRKSELKYMYRAFKIKGNTDLIQPRRFWQIKITFSPMLVSRKYYEIIKICTSENEKFNVILKGSSKGPAVYFSTAQLIFNVEPKMKSCKKVIEIKNTSDLTAIYQFDVDSKMSGKFKIDKLKGELEGRKHTYLNIVFKAEKPGIYCRDLVCLILNHKPIVINVVGLYFPNEIIENQDYLIAHYHIDSYHQGFPYYFKSFITSCEDFINPVNLEKSYVDFGKTEPLKVSNECENSDSEDKMDEGAKQELKITNLTDENMYLKWDLDSTGIFGIIPDEISLPKNETVTVDCIFKPNKPEMVYAKIIKGQIYWTDIIEEGTLKTINLPIFFNIRLIGNTFQNGCVWLPRIEMEPKVITLPPVVPGDSNYATFIIKSTGYLPVLYKFVDPKDSNFTIKPSTGTIVDFQIFCVKVKAETEVERFYSEIWEVIFNNRKESCYEFTVQCYAENLHLTVGKKDTIRFGTVYTDCEKSIVEPIYNPTVHGIQYRFLLDDCDFIKLDRVSGKIESYEEQYLNWTIVASKKIPQKITIDYEMRVIYNGEVITGKELKGKVTVYVRTDYAMLCAIPKYHDFETIRFGERCKTEFQLYNFAQATVNFNLKCSTEISSDFKIEIRPKSGSIESKQSCSAQVEIVVKKTGKHVFYFQYQIRKSENSDQLVNSEAFDVFQVEMQCEYPTLQIIDVTGSTFGPLFSKLVLWELLKIDRLNEIFRTIEAKQTKNIEMNLPDFEEGEDVYVCGLTIKNFGIFDCHFTLKSVKLCKCPPQQVSISFTRRKIVTDCLHNEMTKLRTTNTKSTIPARSSATIEINIKYVIPGASRFLYVINLGNDRTINLYLNVNCWTKSKVMPSSYFTNYIVTFDRTYVGFKNPKIREFRLYNNTSYQLQYEIDTNPLLEVNFDCRSLILCCLNPRDEIEGYSSKSIYFQFRPIEEKDYEVTTTLSMGSEKVPFKIKGRGSKKFEAEEGTMEQSNMPLYSESFCLENSVEISTDHVVIESMDVWNEEGRLIFVKNLTEDQIIGYSWEYQCVPGILSVKPGHRKGILKPKEIQAVLLETKSFDKPSQVLCQIVCDVLNHTQYVAHKKEERIQQIVNDRKKYEFTITEKGMEYPEFEEKIKIQRPKPNYISLAMSVNVTSFKDKDIIVPIPKQFRLTPQIFLNTNAIEVSENYCQTIQKHYTNNLCDIDDTKITDTKKDKINLPKEKIEFLKNTLECLIADAIFSKMFNSIVEEQSLCDSPYYYQFKMADEDSTDYQTTKTDFLRRKKLIEQYLNRPQSFQFYEIFKELIFESLHVIYNLGSPPKNRSNKQYINDLRRKFALPHCNCPKFGDFHDPNLVL